MKKDKNSPEFGGLRELHDKIRLSLERLEKVKKTLDDKMDSYLIEDDDVSEYNLIKKHQRLSEATRNIQISLIKATVKIERQLRDEFQKLDELSEWLKKKQDK